MKTIGYSTIISLYCNFSGHTISKLSRQTELYPVTYCKLEHSNEFDIYQI